MHVGPLPTLNLLGRGKDAVSSSKRLSPLYDIQAQHRSILKAAEMGPLQSLADRELNLRERPVTIYPGPTRRCGPGYDSARKRFEWKRSCFVPRRPRQASASRPRGRPFDAG